MNDVDNHLNTVDLNLLVVLDVLLQTRSTTLAARQLGRTQSATSHALGRLRDTFDDPLLVRVGNGMAPTPLAEAIHPALRDVLGNAADLLRRPERFDPSQLQGRFSFTCAGFTEDLLLPGLLARVATAAPRVDLASVVTLDGFEEAVRDGQVAFGVGPHARSRSGLVGRRLYDEGWATICRADHPVVGDVLDLDTFTAVDHVVASPRGLPGSRVDDALRAVGRTRRVRLTTPRFASAVRLVARTDLLATLPALYARQMARQLPLRVLQPPVSPPLFRMQILYSERFRADPAHRWLRDQVADTLAEARGHGP